MKPEQTGVNGIRYAAKLGYVYYTATAKKLFMRVRVDPETLKAADGLAVHDSVSEAPAGAELQRGCPRNLTGWSERFSMAGVAAARHWAWPRLVR